MQLRKSLSSLLPLLFVCWMTVLLSACHYRQTEDAWMATTEADVDSVDFRTTHHYWVGYNFVAVDTLTLYQRPPFVPSLLATSDSLLAVGEGNMLLVEEIQRDTTDSVAAYWLKVTAMADAGTAVTVWREKPVTGWVRETTLLAAARPATPISSVIHFLGSDAFKISLGVVGVLLFFLLLLVCYRRRASRRSLWKGERVGGYTLLLALVLSGSIVLHRCIWHYVPETWIEYYYYPSLNPLSSQQPPIISLFVVSVWVLIVLALAVLDEWWRKPFVVMLSYAAGYIVIFAVFAVICPFALLPVVLPAFYIGGGYLLLWRHRRRYRCGQCHQPIRTLGKCPHCGAINE
jgi:hypothetical protein